MSDKADYDFSEENGFLIHAKGGDGWTPNPPTKPGWYWAMYLDTKPWVVHVEWHKDGTLKWWEDGVEGGQPLDRISYWLGPLPVPEIPK